MSSAHRRALHAVLPRFWRAESRLHPYASLRSYPRAWALSILLLSAAAIPPVILGVFLDYRVMRGAIRREHELQIVRHASNARRAVAHFLEERLEALSFAAHSLGEERILVPEELGRVLVNLRADFGGISDLGVIDRAGHQVAYCGPFDLEDRDYSVERWFTACRERGAYVSDVYRGHRDVPHVVVAVAASPGCVLRATLDLERLQDALATYAPTDRDDIFLMNRKGVIQTPSRHHGKILEPSAIAIPPPSPHTEVSRLEGPPGESATVGYAYVRTRLTDTPFILVMTRDEYDVVRLSSLLLTSRVLFVGLTTFGLLIVVTLTCTYMFNRLYDAETAKASALGQIEDVNRLVSLGRLAAGVAHEINNPLAVIKESAGYIQDLIDAPDEELMNGELREQAVVIGDSVTRCAAISRQLLSFARPTDLRSARVDLEETIRGVLCFHMKDAEFRNILIVIEVDEDARIVETDGGKLQQVLLNLIANAFDAMPGGGRLRITVMRTEDDEIRIDVMDTGHGVSADSLKSIFEPFFTTKEEGRGTGLGLSITYGIVIRMGGRISVTSREGVGSTFSVVLPSGPPTGGDS